MSYRDCSSCGASKHYYGRLCRKCKSRERRADPQKRAGDRESSRSWKDRNREANRARDRAYSRDPEVRGSCLACNGPMGINYTTDGVCRSCQHDVVIARWEQIEAWWAAGLLLREIASRLDYTMGHLAVEVDRMRKAGRAVPYRYPAYERKAAA